MAERLGSGLQSRTHGFESRHSLHELGSARDGEQLLKGVLHAFGIRRRVWQGVAIRGSADRQRAVVARDDMDKVHAADERPETGGA